MELILIAAVAKNGVIGNKGRIPWHFSEDVRKFKSLIIGHALIMGRATYNSIVASYGKPLESRVNLVVSESDNIKEREGVIICKGLFDALEKARSYEKEVYVIGGERIFSQTILLPEAKRLEITKLKQSYEGDRYFPFIDRDIWAETCRECHQMFDFVRYEKIVYSASTVFESLSNNNHGK